MSAAEPLGQWCIARGADLVLRVRVQPRASRESIEGVQEGRLRVRLTAPPVEGVANARLIRFLAERLGVPRRRLSIARGEQSRSKDVVLGAGAPERASCMAKLLEK